jgi:hypothetical protein
MAKLLSIHLQGRRQTYADIAACLPLSTEIKTGPRKWSSCLRR